MNGSYKGVVVVTGLGRCGSSMLMQMLKAGGADTAGTFPSFGDVQKRVGGRIDLTGLVGTCFKVIDPHKTTMVHSRLIPLGAISVKWIWMERRFAEQAKSQAKIVELVNGWKGKKISSAKLRNWAHNLDFETQHVLKGLRGPVLRLQFEELLRFPIQQGEKIKEFLLPDQKYDPIAGATAVRERGPHCLPDIELERSLVPRIVRL